MHKSQDSKPDTTKSFKEKQEKSVSDVLRQHGEANEDELSIPAN